MGLPCFLDTSALVKLYIEEPGTAWMQDFATAAAAGSLFLSAVASVEIASGFYRLEREGHIAGGAAAELLAVFRADLGWRYVTQPVTDAVLGTAVELIQAHALRAYDAMQLATCRLLARQQKSASPRFISSDRQLLRAAEAEGFACVNPEDEN